MRRPVQPKTKPTNMEPTDLGRALLSLLVVVLLIGGCAWLAKRLGLAQRLATGASVKARLQVTDKLMLDARHKLVLVKRDGKEHLILLGATHSLLLESFDAAENETAR